MATGPRDLGELDAWLLGCQVVRRSATGGISVLALCLALHLEGAAAARKRWIGHEIGMCRKGIAVLGMRIADVTSIRLHIPALSLVFHLRHHDLFQDLLMDGGIFNGNQ